MISYESTIPRIIWALIFFSGGLVFISCSPSKYLAGGSVTVLSVRNVDNRGMSSIIGVVYDSTGFNMGGTNIELIDASSHLSVHQAVVLTANTFSIKDVHPGKYILVANLIGFSKARSVVLEMKANTIIVVDIYLDPEPIRVD